jgi:transcriptional regulator with XRE-family HTH domain
MENIFSELGKIILFHRVKSRLSRDELAKIAGVGKTVIFDIEHGKMTVKLSTLQKILEVLNISIVLKSPYMDEYFK